MRSRSTSSIHYPQPLDERDDGLAHHRTQRSCARRLPGGGRELYRFGRAGGFADDLAIVGAPSVARVDPRRDAGAGGTGPARGTLYQRGADADRYGIAAVSRRDAAGDRTTDSKSDV